MRAKESHTYDTYPASRTTTSRGRQIAGALTIMAGSLPIAYIAAETSYGRPPNLWMVILTIGVVATVAWLIDGRRYLGVATAATAVGAAFTIAQEGEGNVEKYQFALIFGLLGVALLAVRALNPRAVGATGALLVAIGASAALFQTVDRWEYPEAWLYAALMGVWGGIQLLRSLGAPAGRGHDPRPATGDEVRDEGRVVIGRIVDGRLVDEDGRELEPAYRYENLEPSESQARRWERVYVDRPQPAHSGRR